jgi:uncharacterized protein YdaU (DUF1376 family)
LISSAFIIRKAHNFVSKKKLPYMKWYPSDFETDEDVRLMSNEEIGFYLRCLNHAWMHDGLPVDPFLLARLFRESTDDFERLWAAVGRKFYPDPQSGRLVNRRQIDDKLESEEKSNRNRQSAKTRWNANAYANASETHTTTHKSRMPNACLRAYDYDSVSESDSTEGSVRETELIEVSENFASWAEEVYQRHPKHKHLFAVQHELARRFAHEPIVRALFDSNHRLWCQTDEWRKNNGQFCPVLADECGRGWIADEAWRWPPARGDTTRNGHGSAMRAELERLETKRNI